MSGEEIDTTIDAIDTITSDQFNVANGFLRDLLIGISDIPFFSEAVSHMYGGKFPFLPFTYSYDSVWNRQDKFLESLGMEVYADSRMVELVEENLSVLKSAENSAKDMHRNVVKYMGVQELLIRNLAGFVKIYDECMPTQVDELDFLDKIALKLGMLQIPNKMIRTTELDDRAVLDRRVIESINTMYVLSRRIEEHAETALGKYEQFNKMTKDSIPEFAEAWKARLESVPFSKLVEYYPTQFSSGNDVTGLYCKQNGINRVIESFLTDPCPIEGISIMSLSQAKRFLGRMIEMKYTFEGQYRVNDGTRGIFNKEYDFTGCEAIDNVLEFPEKKHAQNE
ncbi:MAG: hypothetical protein V1729_05680 [Candidatus Woesearchaeota archaeon]